MNCALACAAIAAGAQTYPARPLRIVFGFAPGGGVDLGAQTHPRERRRELTTCCFRNIKSM
jgi:tripartite-type tricarboxylate transporter receptor subunit TctC